MGSIIFPSAGLQVLTCMIYLCGLSVLSHCLSRRILSVGLNSWKAFTEIPWPRLCIVLVFVDSWFFLFSSALVIFGIGLETSLVVCATAIYLCAVFYCTSKVFVYLFLLEKVHLVWSPSMGSLKKAQSPIYMLGVTTVGLYTVVICVTLIGRVHLLRHDGACVIGLKTYSSVTLLTYDLYINVFLTALFLWPLFRSKVSVSNPRNRSVAIRNLAAAFVALTTSTINIAILTHLHGKELGWVCLGSCSSDVILNALALFWVTKSTDDSLHNTPEPTLDIESRRPIISLSASMCHERIDHFPDISQPAKAQKHHSYAGAIPGQDLGAQVKNLLRSQRQNRVLEETRRSLQVRPFFETKLRC
ncbi:hypothetical protein Moror_1102 [Moniliophthora roreri MCA 2997]|uniref:Transmembrane protein n=1 Tax=Moniliophthora roreri (strain MCA 2997) TaxID=1381753 RepID=V2XK20_MONRO|nr:hypothetical protein Moror_1102 [Moniliophthora roreri MCA 2997]